MELHKRQMLCRLIAISVAALIAALVVAANLFSIQIINGDEYAKQANRLYSYTSTLEASRGDILDRNGTTLVSNAIVYDVSLTYAFWDRETQNDTILQLAKLIRIDGQGTLNITLPLETGKIYGYVFTESKGSNNYNALMNFCEKKEWGDGLDSDEIMEKLCELYDIDEDYTDAQKLTVAAVRYQMEKESFSMYNSFALASNISIDLVTKLKERHNALPGVEVKCSSQRDIQTSYASNILGYLGPIYAEDWDKYSDKGYSMNAQVGKTGAEAAFEDYLRGADGTNTITTDSKGNVISQEVTQEARSGNNVELTIDLHLQQTAEQALASRCQSIAGAKGGAAVVVDVRNGEVLALANYPTYNLKTFNQDYAKLAKNPLKPLLNRSIAGTYAPGSTFKICTAIAGLESGVIDGKTRMYDTGIYTYYDDYQPKCWIYGVSGRGHGWESVVGAIEDSCNYFFFETGRRLGGSKLEQCAMKLGFGDYTGIELSGESKGIVAGPTERKAARERNSNLRDFGGGDVLQAAIGQGDNAFTPIQLANYCAAVANNGTQYDAHLLKEVKTYDYSETVYEQEKTVRNKVKASDTTWDLVHQGMAAVTGEDGTASEIFSNYSIKVGGKSGTAQITGTDLDNGLFISYAPYNNPQIAVCVVIEGGDSGSNVAPVIRQIYDEYFYGDYGKTDSGSTAD